MVIPYLSDEGTLEISGEEEPGKRVFLMYQPMENPDEFYKTSPDWVTERWMPVADRIFAQMQMNLPLKSA